MQNAGEVFQPQLWALVVLLEMIQKLAITHGREARLSFKLVCKQGRLSVYERVRKTACLERFWLVLNLEWIVLFLHTYVAYQYDVIKPVVEAGRIDELNSAEQRPRNSSPANTIPTSLRGPCIAVAVLTSGLYIRWQEL